MYILVILSLLGAAFAVPRYPQRIVGGRDTSIEQYPFMANMQYLWFGSSWWTSCGGALITTNSILSAAHCFDGDHESQWRVRLGSSFMSSGGTLHAIATLVLHERYNIPTTFDNDIAIVKLITQAVISPSVNTARIGGANYNLADNTLVTVVGWGELWDGGPQPEVLQHVEVATINQALCAERYAYLKTQPGFGLWPDVTPNMLCSGIPDVGGRDACSGDSGGPVLHQSDVIVGITSWGFDCAHSFYPGVNARVSHYTDWIIDNA